ncbi:MAG: TonB-dependent receptor, partial [Bacteroidales bacterium]|nr:TonB-dependent receptor [Bacteroidales bacterium]
MKIIIYICLMLASIGVIAQSPLKGVVYEKTEKGLSPLFNVNIYWKDASIGTVSDETGKFTINRPGSGDYELVFSYIGYKSDTIKVSAAMKKLDVVLSVNKLLKEVVVTERRKSSYVSRMEPIHTQKIEGHELKKAACCNLSESFETNASVDVSYSDAVSGAKQIKLLGLDGKYSQIMTEKVPFIRGLASTYGLGYIPGSWMESIQVSKGTASVSSGYESITGQINVEYKKPDKSEIIYLNALASNKGKIEGNANTRVKLSEKWSTMILLHAENEQTGHDGNKDGFLDQPMIKQFNILNRWKYNSENFMTQFGVKVLDEERIGGQTTYKKNLPNDTDNGYGVNINSKYYELFHKMGIMFKKQNTSLALIHSYTFFDQQSIFGLRNYSGVQNSYNSNLMYKSWFGTTDHNYIAGISYLYDDYVETLNDTSFLRTENVPGGFFEYTYAIPHKYTIMAGIRYDYHSIFGGFVTPRAHIKYDIRHNSTLRASAGKGYRTPNLLAENSYLMASSRKISILEDILMEEAWNFGTSLSHTFYTKKREITANIEFYRSQFVNQLVVDMDKDISNVYFYNLDGKSYSNSAQIELVFEPIKRLDVVMAYRYTDVKATINGELVTKPLVNRYKGLINLSYKTNLDKWQFDFTAQINGDGRLPSTESNPQEYKRNDEFPAYALLHAQVTKYYKKWNVYLGSENLTNFVQDNPIIAADQP